MFQKHGMSGTEEKVQPKGQNIEPAAKPCFAKRKCVPFQKPSKRDKNNEERKRIFEKYSLDLNVSISFPEKSYEVQAFLDELFSLAEIRIKADALIANEPEIREGFPEGKRIERLHYRRERNPKVVRLAKKNFKEKKWKIVLPDLWL